MCGKSKRPEYRLNSVKTAIIILLQRAAPAPQDLFFGRAGVVRPECFTRRIYYIISRIYFINAFIKIYNRLIACAEQKTRTAAGQV